MEITGCKIFFFDLRAALVDEPQNHNREQKHESDYSHQRGDSLDSRTHVLSIRQNGQNNITAAGLVRLFKRSN